MTEVTPVDLSADAPERHFGGSYTRALLAFLHEALGVDGTAAVLREAGETRPQSALSSDDEWSSYAQYRALLEAAARALGSCERLDAAGARSIVDIAEVGLDHVVHQMGSPETLLRNIRAAGAMITPVVELSATQVGERDWRITQVFASGFEPFEAYCVVSRGLHTLAPRMFGYAPPTVVEEECVRRGDPACVFRVQWQDTDVNARRLIFADLRVRTLEERLSEFERTVADLVSGRDLQGVLRRTFDSAARALRTPSFLLTLDVAPLAVESVYAIGLTEAQIGQTCAALDARPSTAPGSTPDSGLGAVPDLTAEGLLAVRVASPHRSYGWIAAIRPTGSFLPADQAALHAYAGFIAAALDSSMLIEQAQRQSEEARRQRTMVEALFALSVELAEISTVDDVAAKLVRAVPLVLDCDRVTVLLPLPDGETFRVAATYGYSTEYDKHLRTREYPAQPARLLANQEYVELVGADVDEVHRESGTVATRMIPVVVGDEWAGAICVGVTQHPERLHHTPETAERLRGLAAQASSAIRNASLLDQVRHQALHDPLTGLPNRALILDRVDQMLARARRNRQASAAMFIDLDGFKEINDSFGHAAGDELLQAVTARLISTLRPSDTVGRLGGDEFVVLVDGASLDAGPELVAERILSVLRQPFHLKNAGVGSLSVTASIGIATGDRASGGDLLRDADVALYGAKAGGKNRSLVFETAMQTSVQNHLLLQMDLQNALAEGRFSLVYQPICNLSSGVITGVEALLRWQHPERGEVQPNDFIPILEDTGMILDVGAWVLREACRQGARWHARGMPLAVAVNVSGRQLQCDRLLVDVNEALRESGFDPEHLVLEITESTMMRDIEATKRRLNAAKALGVKIAIDDFGTGYSSLVVLRDLPVDTLKIDRAFVAGLGDTLESTALMHTLVQLGQTLGLETLAEGIEESVQYQQLENERCESGQGFLIARPLPADELDVFLRQTVTLDPWRASG